jgi:hypothetical protein
MRILLHCQQTWRAMIHKLTQDDMRVYRVRQTSDTTSFAAGKKGRNASTDHDRSATLQEKGMGLGDGNGVGLCPIASDAIGHDKGRDMHPMDSACSSALGVPDAAVREQQRVRSAGRRGT